MWPHSSAHNVFIVGVKEHRDFNKVCLLGKSATEQNTGEQGNVVTVHYKASSIPLECRNLPAWRPWSFLHWFQFHACCCDFKVCYPAGWKLSCFFKLLSWWMICSLAYLPCGFPGQGFFCFPMNTHELSLHDAYVLGNKWVSKWNDFRGWYIPMKWSSKFLFPSLFVEVKKKFEQTHLFNFFNHKKS